METSVKLCPDISDAKLDFFPAEKPNGDALLIIPGGGYGFVSYDREGTCIADAFNKLGISCFVLTYTIGPDAKYPRVLIEAGYAMLHIRSNAERYHINSNRVFTVGFSAGGHLCGMLGTMYNKDEITSVLKCSKNAIRPTGTILCYAVLKDIDNRTHGTYTVITGGDEISADYLDISAQVNAECPPMFFMHTVADGLVNVENSIYTMQACKRNGVTFEAHIYPYGPHGIALANRITSGTNEDMMRPEVEKWVELAAEWMKRV